MAKAAAAPKKALTKTQIISNLADASGLSKKEVASVLEALTAEIKKNVSGRGPGIFTIPGLVKIVRYRKPATPAKKGVLNRFTGQLMDVPAKPASNKIKVRPLKNLKEMA